MHPPGDPVTAPVPLFQPQSSLESPQISSAMPGTFQGGGLHVRPARRTRSAPLFPLPYSQNVTVIAMDALCMAKNSFCLREARTGQGCRPPGESGRPFDRSSREAAPAQVTCVSPQKAQSPQLHPMAHRYAHAESLPEWRHMLTRVNRDAFINMPSSLSKRTVGWRKGLTAAQCKAGDIGHSGKQSRWRLAHQMASMSALPALDTRGMHGTMP